MIFAYAGSGAALRAGLRRGVVFGVHGAIIGALLFGFMDDIVIRITPAGSGSRVDVRSESRVGRSDLGANAGRIREFLRQLAARRSG